MIPHTFPFFEARHFNVSNLHCTRLQTAWPPTVTLLSTLSFSRDFGLANLQFLMTNKKETPELGSLGPLGHNLCSRRIRLLIQFYADDQKAQLSEQRAAPPS